jgi:hypothetical protein
VERRFIFLLQQLQFLRRKVVDAIDPLVREFVWHSSVRED